MYKEKEKVVIIGAGPAGLSVAYYLLKNTDIKPIILEESEYIGGISRTHNHNGNRMDLGGHRFFTKSDDVGFKRHDRLIVSAKKLCESLSGFLAGSLKLADKVAKLGLKLSYKGGIIINKLGKSLLQVGYKIVDLNIRVARVLGRIVVRSRSHTGHSTGGKCKHHYKNESQHSAHFLHKLFLSIN